MKWPGLDDHTIVIHHAPPSINVPRFYNCPENPKMYQFKRKEIPWNTSTRKLVSQSAGNSTPHPLHPLIQVSPGLCSPFYAAARGGKTAEFGGHFLISGIFGSL